MRKLFFLICIFSFIWTGYAQTGIYKFKHLSTADGLSQNSAITIIQDDLGQMWIGTRDGLNKYDGSKFTTYRHNRTNPQSISNSDVLCLEQDSEGYIWVGTATGLNKYNPKKDSFKHYFSDEEKLSLRGNTIWAIKELSNKDLWVGTPSGISIYDRTKDSFKSVSDEGFIFSIFENKKGNVFIGTKNGLKQLVHKSIKGYQFKTIKGTEKFNILDIIESPTGSLLLGTRTQGVLEYNSTEGTVKPYLNALPAKNKNVRQMLLDDKGVLWIGTYGGLLIVDKNKKIRTFNSNINDDESISDDFIKFLFKDRKGSIWIGTYNGGIDIWDKSNVNFITITQKPGNLGIGFKVVSSIIAYKDDLIFGTEGGGISIVNKKTRKIEHINTKSFPALLSDNIKSLYVTEDNNLWIGTFEDAFVVYNLETKKNNTSLYSNLLDYLQGVGVYVIKQDADGNMLIGTIGKGLIRYNLNDKSIKVIDSETKPKGLLVGIVRSIKVDSKANIWVSTIKGLNVIDPQGRIKDYFYDSKLQIGYNVTSVFEDSKGGIWAGTEGDGLFKFVKNQFQAVDLKISNSSAVTGVRRIIEDSKGNFWISTVNQGIVYFNPVNSKVLANYTRKEGLPSNQFNNNASLSISKSKFFFGGPSGAVYFDADNLVRNTYSPQVIITDFKIKNKSINANDESQLLSKTISFTKEMELSYEQGNFSISFSIPNFINSSSNHYQYRLKGLDNDWIETHQNSVSYTIQNPGTYVFEVKGINSDGISNEEPTSLQIRVFPAPWRTWWAFVLYGIAIFIALYYLLNILKSKERLKHQLVLEQNETEQTKALNAAKLEFFTNISHEFRTPLTLILGPLHQILDNYKGSSLMYKKLKVVESNANHLLQLINRLMDFRKLENNIVKLETAEGNIVKFLREIYLSFSEYAKDGNYDYIFQTSSEEIKVYYDRYKLEQVFYNLISNAFRYTPKNGKIVVRVTEKKRKIFISVEDTGVGIAPEYRDKIFERFFEVAINNKPNNDYNKGTGIGLSIVKNIVDLHKGEITIKENENQVGTIFMVKLLLGRKHLSDTEIIQDFKFSDDVSQYVNQLEEKEVFLEEDLLENLTSEDKLTVLLVEDNVELRKFMRDLLIKRYHILEAENGKVGYKIAQKEQVDLIVSDVIMPVMTGTELCSLIKEDIKTSHIPVILLTSRSSLIFKLEGLESGADDYISKPFNVTEFELRVKNLLNSISRLRQKMTSTEIVQPDEIVLSSLDEKLYKKALQIVEANIGNEEFDVLFFCEELGVSRTVLFKKIKAWTDFTPNEFIQHIRLMKGAQLLEQEKLSVSEISYSLGFKNPKYFSKCFSKKFGKTPTEYIKKFNDY
ncbi:hybrid sensor histidine kinase/response regulator transcription factor [Flavobacterium faecale]|uniref:hybrid sensor histidine kinase/response regulator transcription factor n=1 Tax=Flavobacterium faecale TaxID=1355330 RepID=UPI003AAECC9F